MEKPKNISFLRLKLAMRLKTLRERTGEPLKKIAAELGVSVATVNSWECGSRFPSAEHLERLARWYGVRPCILVRNDHVKCPETCRAHKIWNDT